MNFSGEEKERQQYNKKLIKETFKDTFKNEIKKLGSGDKISFITMVIGCFIGLNVKNLLRMQTHISNSVGRFAVEVLIIAACIMVVQAIIFVIRKAIRRN